MIKAENFINWSEIQKDFLSNKYKNIVVIKDYLKDYKRKYDKAIPVLEIKYLEQICSELDKNNIIIENLIHYCVDNNLDFSQSEIVKKTLSSKYDILLEKVFSNCVNERSAYVVFEIKIKSLFDKVSIAPEEQEKILNSFFKENFFTKENNKKSYHLFLKYYFLKKPNKSEDFIQFLTSIEKKEVKYLYEIHRELIKDMIEYIEKTEIVTKNMFDFLLKEKLNKKIKQIILNQLKEKSEEQINSLSLETITFAIENKILSKENLWKLYPIYKTNEVFDFIKKEDLKFVFENLLETKEIKNMDLDVKNFVLLSPKEIVDCCIEKNISKKEIADIAFLYLSCFNYQQLPEIYEQFLDIKEIDEMHLIKLLLLSGKKIKLPASFVDYLVDNQQELKEILKQNNYIHAEIVRYKKIANIDFIKENYIKNGSTNIKHYTDVYKHFKTTDPSLFNELFTIYLIHNGIGNKQFKEICSYEQDFSRYIQKQLLDPNTKNKKELLKTLNEIINFYTKENKDAQTWVNVKTKSFSALKL